MKATEEHFLAVLFIMLYKGGSSFEPVDKLKCENSSESYWAVLSGGAVYYAVQGGSSFWICEIQMKATEQYFPVALFIMLYKVVLAFESVNEILECGHSNESYWRVLSCGAVYCAVQGASNLLSLWIKS